MRPLPLIALCSECRGPMPCACVREMGWAPKAMPRWRSKAYLRFVRGLPCSVPDCCDGIIQAAHMGPRAVGRKVHDCLAVPLCQAHHRESHQKGRSWEYYEDVQTWQVQTMAAALASGRQF